MIFSEVDMSKRQLPYVISYDAKSDFWYCHMRGYAYVPVFGSIGDKRKAQRVCDMMNKSVGAKE